MSTYVVVGANRGIGLELVKQLAAKHTVIATTRKPSAELSALDVRVIEGVDVTDAASVASLAETLADVEIDVLIANAGILHSNSLANLDFDSVRTQFEVNSMGPLRVAVALHPRVRAGGKIGIVTSRMGSIADNDSGGSYGYRMSKAAVNAAGKSLAIDLASKKIAVALLHPGYVRTDMTGHNGMIDPDESASLLLERLGELTLEQSGTFWHANGDELPW